MDRIKVSSTMLTKTEDILTTLTMVRDQLIELKKSDSIGKQDPITDVQKDSIRDIHKSIRKLMETIKNKIINGQEKLRRRSTSEPKPKPKMEDEKNQKQ